MKKIVVKNFSKLGKIIEMPNFLEVQIKSYENFLQKDIPSDKREIHGIQAVFEDVFPIENSDLSLQLDFKNYFFKDYNISPDDALYRKVTYQVALWANFLLLKQDTKTNQLKEIMEQPVFVCNLPLITPSGSFIINGVERVVINQLHRSPGVIFEEDEENKTSIFGKNLFLGAIIPYRGAWVEFEFDRNNIIFAKIDKKKKIFATQLLRAIDFETNTDILKIFCESETIKLSNCTKEDLKDRILIEQPVNKKTGEIFSTIVAGESLKNEWIEDIFKNQELISEIEVITVASQEANFAILETLKKEKKDIYHTGKIKEDAIIDIFKKVKGQDYINKEQAINFIDQLLLKNDKKYNLTKVGRYKINKKLKSIFEELEKNKNYEFKIPNDKKRTLTKEDIIGTIKYLINLNNGISGEVDDIDHLGNRRVRSVGELLENQMRIGFIQMSKWTRDKMNVKDKEESDYEVKTAKTQKKKKLTPKDLIIQSIIEATVRKFFMTSQLSQFLDNTNPMSELTNKRRLSALGPGGLNRKRAGFEVRDVHYTHYGRICPIETPEGANIGLIVSLTCYAKVNDYGLIETPYRKVESGKILEKIEYHSADIEDTMKIAQAMPKTAIKINNEEEYLCRIANDYISVEGKDVNYIDVSPLQIFSPATALVPFLEHDDANRALMGSNMQRQSVPLLFPEFPIVGTGIESKIAVDSKSVVTAIRDGIVDFVDSDKVVIKVAGEKTVFDEYKLKKYQRSNQDTMINFMPIVSEGEELKKGAPIADGPSTKNGQLALGTNVTAAFMSWEGFNFEDAIIISDRLVKDDVLTSINILMFDIEARDTKFGPEEITKDLPGIGTEMLANLDERGIIRIGTEVQPGDILVGKVRPKSEQTQTVEERLLRQIFNKKSEDVIEDSLRVSPGVTGKVIDVRVVKRKLSETEEKKEVKKIKLKYETLIKEGDRDLQNEIMQLEKKLQIDLKEIEMNEITHTSDSKVSKNELKKTAREKISKIKEDFRVKKEYLKEKKEKELDELKKWEFLPLNVNEYIRVFIASRRKIQVGDKLAGRHGNKGVIAKILASEDMPYLPDGTTVDILLSPLSVPSRMNVGQIYELMMGWAANVLGYQAVLPVFDGPTEKEVLDEIKEAKKKLAEQGIDKKYIPDDYLRIQLYDGRTGEPFENKVTVGVMYIMKLVHMVEDKVHARSTGPYSLVTRQPLGGKAQFGGQRMGEMEIWAIEGYGASYILQEFLTIKSDDVSGRLKMYNAIIRGGVLTEPSVPESFKVLVKELQALCINVELIKEQNIEKEDKNTVKK